MQEISEMVRQITKKVQKTSQEIKLFGMFRELSMKHRDLPRNLEELLRKLRGTSQVTKSILPGNSRNMIKNSGDLHKNPRSLPVGICSDILETCPEVQ